MRPSLSRAPGLLLCLALAIAPNLAWAATNPVRTNLGKIQTSVTEDRWQPISKTDTVTGPWEIVNSKTWVQQTKSGPLARFQQYRTDNFRQRTTTYPMEAKERRTKTTTTQNYELKTYVEQSTTSTVMVPVAKEVGEWVTTSVDKPVTTTIQELSTEPRLVTVQEPVYKTVTATYSIPGQPVLTPFSVSKTRQETQTVTVTKYRTQNVTQTVREKYNGEGTSYYGATNSNVTDRIKVLDDGFSMDYTSPLYFGASNANQPIRFKANYLNKLHPEDDRTSWTAEFRINGQLHVANLSVKDKGDHDELYLWVSAGKYAYVTLKAHLFRKQVITTVQVPYTETETRTVAVPYSIPFSIQLEKRTNKPQGRQGAAVTVGVIWKHHHGPGISCPYEKIITRSEVAAGRSSPILGKVAPRLTALGPDAESAFTLTTHHTDVLPTFEDELTPPSIGTRSETVLSHYESRTVWDRTPHLVSRVVPVQTVVRWLPITPGTYFVHTHDDPTRRCELKYLKPAATTGGSQAGRPGPTTGSGGTRPPTSGYGNSSGVNVNATSGTMTISHTMQPEFGPLTEKVPTTAWATRSITVMEPRTVTSTYSALVKTVPGQEVSTSYSPWLATGDQRRVGNGAVKEATRSVDVALRTWTEDPTAFARQNVTPLSAQTASFTSDRSAGSARQVMSGNSVRKQLKTTAAVSSKPRVAETGRGTISTSPTPRPGNGNGGVQAQSTGKGPQSSVGGPGSDKQAQSSGNWLQKVDDLVDNLQQKANDNKQK